MSKNRTPTIPKMEYLKAGQIFDNWASKVHYVLFLTGSVERHRRTEIMLPRLEKSGKLISKRFGRKKIYIVPRRKGERYIEHGLGCTECLVRFYRSDINGIIIPERKLRGFHIRPDGGIIYPNNKILLFEFCTESNLESGAVKSKVTRYENNLDRLEHKFKVTAIVVFIIDVHRLRVDRFVQRYVPMDDVFYFTDYHTFLNTEYGNQLSDGIYINGEDGWPYALRSKNV